MTYYSALHYAAKAEAAATTATTLLPYLTDITTVANNIASVNTVSADISSIITAATNIASINTVATSISDISAVVSNAANINTVATNISNVNTTATNISNVNSVASDLTNIDAVAGDLTNINAVAADLTNIDNASQYAAEAKQWAIGDPSEPVDGSAKYWAQQAAGQVIPSQTGHSGEFLTTDGTALSWDTVDALPDQTGQSGKFLTTDGTDASWTTVSVTVDQVYDSTSANAQSGVAINGAKFIQNTATGAGSLSAGSYSSATGTNAVAFGFYAQAHANGALQIGQGQNTIANTFQVGSYRLLNTSTGIIPYQRINAITDSNAGGQLKSWTGTKAQYEAIVTKDANTLYNITDDTDVTLTILDALYPVGSIYITTNATCPLSGLIAGSNWSLVSTGIVKAGDIPCKGNGMTFGLTDGTYYGGLQSQGVSPKAVGFYRGAYDVQIGTNAGSTLVEANSLGVTTDETKSGIIADTSSLTLAVNIFRRTA